MAHEVSNIAAHDMLWLDEAQDLPAETLAEVRALAESDLDGSCRRYSSGSSTPGALRDLHVPVLLSHAPLALRLPQSLGSRHMPTVELRRFLQRPMTKEEPTSGV